MTKVNVVGLGYIGLPTACLLAQAGHQVFGVDVQKNVVDLVNSGQAHFEEKGLSSLVKTAVSSGKLKASIAPQEANVHLIIVPTPFIESDKSADMSYVRSACKSLCAVLKADDLVVLESTSALGATRKDVQAIVEAERPELKGQVHYAFCPERAIPGNTLHELIHNDRVVGGVSEQATEKAVSFYQSFIEGDILPTNDKVAEMVKLSENAFRDVNIAYANELSIVCDELDIDVWEVIRLANHHPRVNILQPGPGVGGHCIAIDPWFIVAASNGKAKLMKQAREINDSKPRWVVSKILEAMSQTNKQNPTVGLLGLAFKPNVDDLRESPALTVAQLLKEKVKSSIIACEPFVKQLEGFTLVNQKELCEQADVVVMLTDHDTFKTITLEQLTGKQWVDTRGALK